MLHRFSTGLLYKGVYQVTHEGIRVNARSKMTLYCSRYSTAYRLLIMDTFLDRDSRDQTCWRKRCRASAGIIHIPRGSFEEQMDLPLMGKATATWGGTGGHSDLNVHSTEQTRAINSCALQQQLCLKNERFPSLETLRPLAHRVGLYNRTGHDSGYACCKGYSRR